MNTNSQNDIVIPFDASYAQRKALKIEIETEEWLAIRALRQSNSLKAQRHTLKVIELKQRLAELNK